MKVIALILTKNEGWILGTTIPQMRLFADEILCCDGGSTDDTREILNLTGVVVRNQDQSDQNYSRWRQELLDWGRERGGTHFIWLDADEAFTSNLLPIFRQELSELKPGQKLSLQWLCLWKTPYKYRMDNSVWSNLFKDFVFCDDGTSQFKDVSLHEGRTPGINNKTTLRHLPTEKGAVLHFQFVPFKRFQIKQAHRGCIEYVLLKNSARRVNNRYSIMLDDPNAKTVPIPSDWLKNIKGLREIEDTEDTWYNKEVLSYFKKYGVGFFEPLQLWHVKKYKDIFVKQIGREPEVLTYPKPIIWLNDLKNKLKNKLHV